MSALGLNNIVNTSNLVANANLNMNNFKIYNVKDSV
jgi:hypothetical protein